MLHRFVAAAFAVLFCLVSACGSSNEHARLADARPQGTRYPIILHHGFLGFDRIFTIEYFWKVRSTLRAQGYDVYITSVSPANSIDYRMRQLAARVDEVLAATGAGKVNIIAHSMGGLDARSLVASEGYGDRVASITTIGTPHRGTPVADLASGLTQAENGLRIVRAFEHLVLGHIDDKAGLPGGIDLAATITNLTTRYVDGEFNSQNVDDPRVVYESWAGQATFTGIGKPDAVDPLLMLPHAYLRLVSGSNDGLVPATSAQYGTFRGYVEADHINEIGHLFGATSKRYNHLEFYSDRAKELAARGF